MGYVAKKAKVRFRLSILSVRTEAGSLSAGFVSEIIWRGLVGQQAGSCVGDESMDSGEGATDAAWRARLVYSKRQEAFPS